MYIFHPLSYKYTACFDLRASSGIQIQKNIVFQWYTRRDGFPKNCTTIYFVRYMQSEIYEV